MDEKNVLMGILAIILGIVVIAFPYISLFTFSVMAGIGILILGIWFLLQTFSVWEDSKAVSIIYLILGLIAIVAGIGMMGDIQAFSFLTSFIIYLAGFYLLFSGILTLLLEQIHWKRNRWYRCYFRSYIPNNRHICI